MVRMTRMQIDSEVQVQAPRGGEAGWLGRVADMVTERIGSSERIVCASGISPSGPIHLGNLREVMVTHLVAEALRSRGHDVRHIHSWDDFDRLRSVPADAPPELGEHIGRPLCDVPDPDGEHGSFAERNMEEFEYALGMLGVRPETIRQSEAYRRGDYVEGIKAALAHRELIFDVLAEHQTADRVTGDPEDRRRRYYPFRPYCAVCGKDDTTVTGYDAASERLAYRCACGHDGELRLSDRPLNGKLVWKVDWPMRWWQEGVDFEPAGTDHHTPGGSFTVGKRVVREVYGGVEPTSVVYSFVGLAGAGAKMSGSRGDVVTPAMALEVVEPAVLRWLYARPLPQRSFTIDLGRNALQRLYDEWDGLARKIREDRATPVDRALHDVSVRSTQGDVAAAEVRVPFRLLVSTADLTKGNQEQMTRIVGGHLDTEPSAFKPSMLEPRLGCAIRYALNHLPPEERTTIRSSFDTDAWESLEDEDRRGVTMLVEHMDDAWTVDGLTRLVYGIPKVLRGSDMDAPPDADTKKAQRKFFVAIYQLICASDTGPRIPTLFLALGQDRVRDLLVAPQDGSG